MKYGIQKAFKVAAATAGMGFFLLGCGDSQESDTTRAPQSAATTSAVDGEESGQSAPTTLAQAINIELIAQTIVVSDSSNELTSQQIRTMASEALEGAYGEGVVGADLDDQAQAVVDLVKQMRASQEDAESVMQVTVMSDQEPCSVEIVQQGDHLVVTAENGALNQHWDVYDDIQPRDEGELEGFQNPYMWGAAWTMQPGQPERRVTFVAHGCLDESGEFAEASVIFKPAEAATEPMVATTTSVAAARVQPAEKVTTVAPTTTEAAATTLPPETITTTSTTTTTAEPTTTVAPETTVAAVVCSVSGPSSVNPGGSFSVVAANGPADLRWEFYDAKNDPSKGVFDEGQVGPVVDFKADPSNSGWNITFRSDGCGSHTVRIN